MREVTIPLDKILTIVNHTLERDYFIRHSLGKMVGYVTDADIEDYAIGLKSETNEQDYLDCVNNLTEWRDDHCIRRITLII